MPELWQNWAWNRYSFRHTGLLMHVSWLRTVDWAMPMLPGCLHPVPCLDTATLSPQCYSTWPDLSPAAELLRRELRLLIETILQVIRVPTIMKKNNDGCFIVNLSDVIWMKDLLIQLNDEKKSFQEWEQNRCLLVFWRFLLSLWNNIAPPFNPSNQPTVMWYMSIIQNMRILSRQTLVSLKSIICFSLHPLSTLDGDNHQCAPFFKYPKRFIYSVRLHD